MKKKKEYVYYGLFLDEKDAQTVRERVSCNSDVEKFYVDHVTLLFNTEENKFPEVKEFCKQNLGKEFRISLTHIGINEKACAFKVNLSGVPCAKETPHITIFTRNGGRPKDSNNIENWRKLPKEFELLVKLDVVR